MKRSGSGLHQHGRAKLAISLVYALACLLSGSFARAENGSEAWLRYRPLTNLVARRALPHRVVQLSQDEISKNAAAELTSAIAVLGAGDTSNSPGSAIFIGLKRDVDRELHRNTVISPGLESFRIETLQHGPRRDILITAASPAAEIYGAFRLLELLQTYQPIDVSDAPESKIRWTDEWDNLDGSIERGYAGRSIFFEGHHVRADLSRARAYARLLASVGINGCNVNNVNADLDLLTSDHIREFARLAEAFRPWGVRLSLSIDLSSPQTVGGLSTFDPLDPNVIAWWQQKIDELYREIPDFAGFTVKADSEGRAGPAQYGRSPADAANVLARALQPHGGVVLYRGFVYNHHLDWHDLKADRARAGYDNFAKYDGMFEPNVIVQIKHGPIDFQAREPVSPLFGALRHTAQAIELQTSQEYTGQQRHMVFLPAMWKWVLETDLLVDAKPSTVADIVTGKRFAQSYGGFVSVVNAGTDANWLHHPMAMANLYGFGKLAWHPSENLGAILRTWSELTWGDDPKVVGTISAMLSDSWQTYEGYTGPNGMGTLTNILGVHFGPGIESAEHNGWGQWFRGEKDGVGMDRTVATGTGFIGQYPTELAAQYESLTDCPDDLLLFFHHVPYDHKLHSGNTLIQQIYDTHYASALRAAKYVAEWETLEGKVDPERYSLVDRLLIYQAGHAIVWRDAINVWFQTISGIPDAKGRVLHDSNRYEAEDMATRGYMPVDIAPAETASGGRAVICKQETGCTLSTKIHQSDGLYNIAVQYFDLRTGVSHYSLQVNDRVVATWASDDTLPPAVVRSEMDGQTSTHFTARSIELHQGDTLKLVGIPDTQIHLSASEDPAGEAQNSNAQSERRELAPVDYVELGPAGPITPQ